MANWLTRLFSGRSDADKPHLLYAIGDVHGRRDLLRKLLEMVHEDRGDRRAEVFLLGDYIDRGPDPAGVIEDLATGAGFGDADVTCLKGNHEATLLAFLADSEIGPKWAQLGGLETIASYGIKPPRTRSEPSAWETTRQALVEAMPDHHLAFLNGLGVTEWRGDFLFVHAGIDPRRPIQVQTESEFLWIRDAFHRRAKRLKFTVVHGHSAKTKPIRAKGRICVDTGAHSTGHLTAVRLDGRRKPRFIAT